LGGVLGILPGPTVLGDIRLGALLERYGSRCLGLGLLPLGTPVLNRVLALIERLPTFSGALARLSERPGTQ
jgi:hypothetical protein